MKRFMMLVGVAVVAGAMYVAASPASQQANGPSAKQFKALKKQVATLSKTLKAVKTLAVAEGQVLVDCTKQGAVPINQFGNPQPAAGQVAEGYDYRQGATIATPTKEFYTTGLDVTAPTDTGAAWIMLGDAACGTDLNGSGLRHAASQEGVRLSRASSHRPSFRAHRP